MRPAFFPFLAGLALALAASGPGGRPALAADPPQAAVPHRAPRVSWAEDEDWAAVVARAGSLDKPILVDFYATWCGPCKLLDAMVYNEKPVIAELADVLTFKVDVDKERYDDLEEVFGIERLPTLVWCDADGTELGRFTGYVSAGEFLATVRDWKADRERERSLATDLRASPRDPRLLTELALRRLDQGRTGDVSGAVDLLAALAGDSLRSDAAEGVLKVAVRVDGAGDRGRAAEFGRRVLGMYPAEAAADRTRRTSDLAGLDRLAEFQAALGDTAGLMGTYERMLAWDRYHLPALAGFAGLALAQDARLPEATTHALRAVIRSDKDPEMIRLLAACYHRRGFTERAVKWMAEAVSGAPGNLDLQADLARYRELAAPKTHR
ncbi:MAG: thioredoxin domain-containing protein [Candidatus Krumholzibacteriia bacterium]